MLKGWKIFKYTRKINNKEDIYSYCKTNITKYHQSLFTNEDSFLTFYSSPSKSLELMIFKDSFEIRLFDWKKDETRMIILDKILIKENYKCNYMERTLFLNGGSSYVIFYKLEELKEFREAAIIDEDSKMEDDSICAIFAEKINSINNGNCQYISDYSLFIKELNSISNYIL